MQCNGLSDLTTVEVRKVTTTVPASLLKFSLKCSLYGSHLARFCWERGRPVRIEREARRLVNPRKIASACGAVRTGRPRSQQQVARSHPRTQLFLRARNHPLLNGQSADFLPGWKNVVVCGPDFTAVRALSIRSKR